jgi:hypothetical protein
VRPLHNRAIPVAAVALGLLVAACSGTSPTPTPSPTPSPAFPRPQTLALVAALRAGGATVQVAEVMRTESFPFFAVPAVRITVDGENIYAFEYTSVPEAEAEARRISPGGFEIGMTHVDWISDPHFYRSEQLIVTYVGRTPLTLRLLEQILGPQIAGRT